MTCSKSYGRLLQATCLGLLTTLAIAGCGSSSDKKLDGGPGKDGGGDAGPAASLSVDKPVLDFSTVVQGTTSTAPMAVLVSAKGVGSAALSPVITSGPFSIASTTCTTTLAAGTNCTINVNFTPTALGIASGTLTVATGLSVTLTGTGIAPAGFELTGADLATVKVNESVAGTVTVTATTAVSGLSCSTSGPDIVADATKPCPATLAVGASCNFGFTFKATTVGAKTDKVVCSTAGATRTGTITANVVTPAALDIQPSKAVQITSPVGVATSPITLAVVNSGGSPSGVLSLSQSGDKDQFSVENQCFGQLAAGDSCKMIVIFAPTAKSDKPLVLTLTVTDAASPTTSLVATVTGTATPPGSLTLKGEGAFGTSVVGQSTAAKVFTLSNPGQTATGVVTVSTTDSQFVITDDGCSKLPLDAGKSCTVSVVFKPSAAGAAPSANLTASAPGTAAASLPLTGTGQGAAALSMTPSGLDFAGVVINTSSAPKTFTVTNVGQSDTGALEVKKLDSTSSVGGASQFVVNTTCVGSLKPGDTCTVSVVFTPLLAQSASASIVVRTTDGAVSTQEGTLLGIGLNTANLAVSVCKLSTDLAPAGNDFGAGTVVGVTKTTTCTLTNSADTASGAITVATTGDFAVTTNTCANANLQKNTSCTFVIGFTPTAKGTRTSTLSITSANAGNATKEFAGKGQGIIEIVPYDLTGAIYTTEKPFVFDQVTVGRASTKPVILAVYVRGSVGNLNQQFALGTPKQFVENKWDTDGDEVKADLTDDATALTPAQLLLLDGGPAKNCSDFALTAPAKSDKPVCYTVVSFAPTARATAQGTVTIAGAAGQTDSVTFSGVGAGPLTIAPSPVTFSNVAQGTASPEIPIRIKNNGPAAISNASFTLSGTGAAQFSVVTDTVSGNTFQPVGTADGADADNLTDDTQTIGVRFIPTSTGEAKATITVTGALAGGLGNETATVELIGNGAAGASVTISIANNGVFADTAAGAYSAPLAITVTNAAGGLPTGTVAVVDSPEFTITPPTTTPATSQGTCATTMTTVPGGSACTYLVWFKPDRSYTLANRTATLTVTASPASLVIPVSGKALPQLTIDPAGTAAAPTDLGTATVNTTPAGRTFTVTNHGDVDIAAGDLLVSVGSSTAGSSMAGFFTIDASAATSCNHRLVKGGTCTFKVNPAATTNQNLGAYFAQIKVQDKTALGGGKVSAQKVAADVTATVVDEAKLAFTASTDKTPQHLGTIALNGYSAPVKYTLINNGGTKSGPISAALFEVGTSNPQIKATRFSVDASACPSGAESNGLNPGQTCDILVTAHPTINAPTDVGVNPMTADLVVKAAPGIGTELRYTVQAVSTASQTAPFLVEDGTALAPFNLGTYSSAAAVTVTKTIALHNPGTAAFALTTTASGNPLVAVTALTGADTDTVTLTAGATKPCALDGSVAPSDKCTMKLTWTINAADDSGIRTKVVTISGVSMTVYGSVAAPAKLSVSRQGNAGAGGLSLGEVVTQSPVQTVLITNSGEVATKAGDIDFTLNPADGTFHVSGCDDVVQPLGGTCTLSVYVTPKALGFGKTGTITVTGGAAPNPVLNVGWDAVDAVSLQPSVASYNFDIAAANNGPLAVLDSNGHEEIFTFSNGATSQTTGPLAISVVNSAGAVVPDFLITGGTCLSVDSLPANVAHAGECTVKVRFMPTTVSPAIKRGTLTVKVGSGSNETAAIELKGTATAALSVAGAGVVQAADGSLSLQLADTAVGNSSAEVELTYRNANGSPTTGLIMAAITGTDATQFRASSDKCSGEVLTGSGAATDTCKVKVLFAPTSAGAKTATITLTGNPGGTVVITLKGKNPA